MTIQFKSEFARQATEMLAFAAVKAILNGRPDAGRALLTECGEYRRHVKQLLKAGLTGNSQRLLQTFQQLCRTDPNFQALIDAYMEGMDLFVPYFDAQNLLKPAPANEPTTVPALVPGFLPIGLSILAGRPKLGKSWLALQFATALAHTERQQEILTALAALGPTALTPLAAYIGQDRSNLLRRLKTLLQTGAILRTCNDHQVVVYSLTATPTHPTNPTNATNSSPLPPSSPTTALPTALPTPTTTQP